MTDEPEERWQWLKSTRELQEESFGVNYATMAPGTEQFANYVSMNVLAAHAELSEVLQEVGWKPWADPRGWVNREGVLKECVDTAHFLANVLSAIGVSDDEWEAAYQAKQQVNRERQAVGYDGVSGKCPHCKRSYDDGIKCVPGKCVGVAH